MAKEKRLIDANELSEKIGDMKYEITRNHGGYQYCNEEEKNEWDKLDFFDTLVCEASTVDAVEVVRCRECEHLRSGRNNFGVFFWCGHAAGLTNIYDPDKDYCPRGERRADERRNGSV